MSAAPGTPAQKQTKPRPGHADLAGMQKYNFDDARDVLERASARETAARVVAGRAREVAALHHRNRDRQPRHPHRRGRHAREPCAPCPVTSRRSTTTRSAASTPRAPQAMVKEIKAAAKVGDSLGGIVEVIAYGVPVGLGSHVHWDRKLDGLLAGALMSIQAVKAVEIGDGFALAALRGSVAHDAIAVDDSFDQGGGFIRRTDHAGGTEGGISSGAPVIAKVAMKPLSTLNRPVLETVDVVTHETAVSFKERTDVTAVPALGVVTEAMMALVVANEALRKFGGDSVEEFTRNHASYIANLGSTSSAARPE